VLTRDVRFDGWDVGSWLRFLALFEREEAALVPTSRSGGVMAVHDGGRLRKLLHTRVGRLDPLEQTWPVALEALAERHEAAWAVSLHMGALDEIMERWGARATRSDDIVAQALSLAAIAREMAVEGAIAAWPMRLEALRLPSTQVVSRAASSLCPEGRVVAGGLFEDGHLVTAIVVRRRADGFDSVLGPGELLPHMGLQSGDWRRDYAHLVRAIDREVGPLAAGVFTETRTLRRLLADPAPGAWARAVAVRDVIVSPMSFAAALPLVVDATRGAVVMARALSERYDPTGRLAPVLRQLRADPATPRGPRSLIDLARRLIDG
jgi:hypothetical protein